VNTNIQQIIQDSAVDLRQRAMLVKLAVAMPRNRGRDRAVTNEVHKNKGAAKDAGAYSKRLYDKMSLKPLDNAALMCRPCNSSKGHRARKKRK